MYKLSSFCSKYLWDVWLLLRIFGQLLSKFGYCCGCILLGFSKFPTGTVWYMGEVGRWTVRIHTLTGAGFPYLCHTISKTLLPNCAVTTHNTQTKTPLTNHVLTGEGWTLVIRVTTMVILLANWSIIASLLPTANKQVTTAPKLLSQSFLSGSWLQISKLVNTYILKCRSDIHDTLLCDNYLKYFLICSEIKHRTDNKHQL